MAPLEELVMPEKISQLLESHMFEKISLILQDEYPGDIGDTKMI